MSCQENSAGHFVSYSQMVSDFVFLLYFLSEDQIIITSFPVLVKCFNREHKRNSILGSRRTECMRSRDYFRHVQQQRHELSRSRASQTANSNAENA